MHAAPRTTATQTLARRLHSRQTLYVGMLGLRPANMAPINSINWCLLMGQPRSSKSTGTCSATGVDIFSALRRLRDGRALRVQRWPHAVRVRRPHQARLRLPPDVAAAAPPAGT